MNFPRERITHIISLILLGFFVYSNTFNAPFELDDKRVIIDGRAIKDFVYFDFDPPGSFYQDDGSMAIELESLKHRYIGYLSFALNYRVHGLDVTGYHIFNLMIHLANALLVYALVLMIFNTPYFVSARDTKRENLTALFSALIFVVHPIQTQAVTYIVQRFASLATLFYLLSLVLYIAARISGGGGRLYALYFGSIASAILAMKTKEIAFTLPIIIAFCEGVFFKGDIKKRLLYLLPLLLTMLVIPLSLIYGSGSQPDIITQLGEKTAKTTVISRLDYLATQFRVIMTYIRLMLLPTNQNLDYDYPVFHSFFNAEVILSFLLFLSIAGAAVYLFFYTRRDDSKRDLRLVAFGIGWFFITLSVESSIIPITDVIFEHRTYLPSSGFIIAMVTSILIIRENVRDKIIMAERAIIPFLAVFVLILAVAAYARNSVWKDEVKLWEDTVRKSPKKARPHYNLGAAYGKNDRLDEAISEFKQVLTIEDFDSLHYNLGWIYFKKNMLEDAEREYLAAIKLNPDYTDAYINLSVIYLKQSRFDDAIKALKKAIAIKPDDPEAHYNLGSVYEGQGLLNDAIEEYRVVLRQRPKLAEEHNNIGVEFFRKGRFKEAERKYRIAIGLNPNMDQPHYNLGLALKKMECLDEATKEFGVAIRLKPDNERAYYNLGLIYKEKGFSKKAIEAFQTALKLKPDYHDASKELVNLKFAPGTISRERKGEADARGR